MTVAAACAFLDDWSRAFVARDVEGLVALYTTDALFFGSTPGLAEGHEGIRQYFEQLAPREEMRVAFDILAVRVPRNGLVVVASLATFQWRGNTGVRTRFTHTLIEDAGAWLAAGHHASPG